MNPNTPKTLRCTKCRKIKPAEKFYPDKTRPNGMYPWCRSCHGKARNERYVPTGRPRGRPKQEIPASQYVDKNTRTKINTCPVCRGTGERRVPGGVCRCPRCGGSGKTKAPGVTQGAERKDDA